MGATELIALGRLADAARGTARREGRLSLLLTEAGACAQRRDELLAALERGWVWLDRNPGSPKHGQNEDHWLGWLGEYETLENALQAAQGVIA